MQNNWLGLTYMALQQLEGFGMSYARAVEVALSMQKVQFAKTLIGKQASVAKLREKVTRGRTLIGSLAFECKNTSDPEIQVRRRLGKILYIWVWLLTRGNKLYGPA